MSTSRLGNRSTRERRPIICKDGREWWPPDGEPPPLPDPMDGWLDLIGTPGSYALWSNDPIPLPDQTGARLPLSLRRQTRSLRWSGTASCRTAGVALRLDYHPPRGRWLVDMRLVTPNQLATWHGSAWLPAVGAPVRQIVWSEWISFPKIDHFALILRLADGSRRLPRSIA